jgi:hypothetical protein
MASLALLMAMPLAAQVPAGMQMRVDRSTNAADPDDVPEVTVTTVDGGFEVNTGPAVVLWNPSSTATGSYSLHGTFRLLEPSGHANYYGLVFGGNELEGSGQNYLYFLVAQNGTFIVKHRAGDETTHDVVGRTPHDAVAEPGDDGTSVNDLEVRVGADELQFVVNGTVVHTQPKAGMASRTDGIWGVRVNHQLPGVVVQDLGVGM